MARRKKETKINAINDKIKEYQTELGIALSDFENAETRVLLIEDIIRKLKDNRAELRKT
jgi:hypothetical protein